MDIFPVNENTDAFLRIKSSGLPVLLYGMGNGADRMREYFDKFGIELRGVFANDEFVRGQSYAGFKVINYARAKKRFGRFCAVTAYGTKDAPTMELMRRVGEEQLLIFPDLPLFGGELADSAYFIKNKDRINAILGKTDGISREILSHYLNYRRTGELSYLDGQMTDEISLFSALSPNCDDVYTDFGAYDGDSIRSYIAAAGGYRRIIAAEPDVKSYKKLMSYTSGMENVKAVNAAVSEKTGIVTFSNEGSRNSHLDESGTSGVSVNCVSPDELLSGEEPGFIKLDLEGHEMPALRGMRETILKHRPKIMAAVYHRTDDVFEIPEYILSLVPEYKLSFRKVCCYPGWDMFALFTL